MQFPQKDLRFAPLRLVQFYDISSMHTLGLVRVTVPTWPIQKSLKSLKVRVFGDPGLRMFAWHVYKKRTNLSASSSHDLFNILKCPFEGHHKTSNGSIKEGHFEEAEESSRSHPHLADTTIKRWIRWAAAKSNNNDSDAFQSSG